MMSRRVLLPLVAFLFGVLVFGSAIVWWTGSRLPAGGSVTSSIGGAFRLTAHDGRIVSDKDMPGTPTVVFFDQEMIRHRRCGWQSPPREGSGPGIWRNIAWSSGERMELR
jgi:hypothetical protein